MPTADIANLADIVRVHGAERPDVVALHVGDRTVTFAELVARSSRVANALRGREWGPVTGSRSSRRTGPEDIAVQLYTSGTTGLPKGVMLKNSNFFSLMSSIAPQWRFTADSVNLAVMPMFHIAGSGWAMVGMYCGCTTVVMRDVDPAAILEAIPIHRVSNILLVPAVIQFVLMTPGVEETDLSSLRAIVYGASPISDDVLTKGLERFGCEFIGVYGLTETTGAITQLKGVDHDPVNRPQLLRSCGKPHPWVEVRIVDANGEDVPTCTVGELWTRSTQNMLGF